MSKTPKKQPTRKPAKPEAKPEFLERPTWSRAFLVATVAATAVCAIVSLYFFFVKNDAFMGWVFFWGAVACIAATWQAAKMDGHIS